MKNLFDTPEIREALEKWRVHDADKHFATLSEKGKRMQRFIDATIGKGVLHVNEAKS